MKTSIQQRGLAQLRTLLLDFESDTVFHLSVFKEAIGLKELTLQYAILNGAPEFPWANLRKLTIKLCHYNSEPENTFLSALQSMSLLEELEISTRDKITCASQIITLPSLHTLTIGHGDKSQIWSVLCTPKLSNIQMMNNVCGNIGSLSRMGTSMVQRLHLFYVFKRLIWNPNSGSVQLLPLLQKIQLSLYYHETVEPTDFIQALLRIMRSRSPSSSAVMNQKPLPLLFVKCTEMGIKVEIVLQKGNEKLEWDMDEDFEDFEDDISM
ncbi:hypothetical protein BDQ17DRAFT_1357032 [Cyathus striatus]|nr:hypothetical protein BDQ17DRAFT_1357032 [Cyathus striatus]